MQFPQGRNKQLRYRPDFIDPVVALGLVVGIYAIAAGLHKVADERLYSRLLISRPVVPMGNDLGYLPGDINEKLAPWMQPLYDNFDLI